MAHLTIIYLFLKNNVIQNQSISGCFLSYILSGISVTHPTCFFTLNGPHSPHGSIAGSWDGYYSFKKYKLLSPNWILKSASLRTNGVISKFLLILMYILG